MTDNYPRVHGNQGSYYTGGDDFKIVPADAIVIERSELPPVTRGRMNEAISGDFGYTNPDAAHDRAVALLAIEGELRARPSVDEREVEALTQALVSADDYERNEGSWTDYARRLLATGKVHVDV